MRCCCLRLLALLLVLASPSALHAQAPAAAPAPPSRFSQTANAGLALTSGNKDTSTLNLGYELVYDPKTRNLMKADGLFLRGKSDGELAIDRLSLNGRDEYQLHDRAFVFTQMQYLRDQFKNIEYLASPSAGLGYRLSETARTKVSVDAAIGGLWEKPLRVDVQQSAALTLGEKLAYQLSPSAAVTHTFSALYRTNNFDDALYTVGAAVAASVTSRTQLKVELLDSYKTLVPDAVEKNDLALIVGMVFKR